jgi:hypothetical protein
MNGELQGKRRTRLWLVLNSHANICLEGTTIPNITFIGSLYSDQDSKECLPNKMEL